MWSKLGLEVLKYGGASALVYYLSKKVEKKIKNMPPEKMRKIVRFLRKYKLFGWH